MTPVKSSNIKGVAYDADKRDLSVWFHSGGGSYHVYHDVDPKHFDGIKSADSAGKYLNTHLRGLKSTKMPAPEKADGENTSA